MELQFVYSNYRFRKSAVGYFSVQFKETDWNRIWPFQKNKIKNSTYTCCQNILISNWMRITIYYLTFLNLIERLSNPQNTVTKSVCWCFWNWKSTGSNLCFCCPILVEWRNFVENHSIKVSNVVFFFWQNKKGPHRKIQVMMEMGFLFFWGAFNKFWQILIRPTGLPKFKLNKTKM